MNLKQLIERADNDALLDGEVSLSAEEWGLIRAALSKSRADTFAEQLRLVIDHFGLITYAKDHRDMIAASEKVLLDNGEHIYNEHSPRRRQRPTFHRQPGPKDS